MQPERLSVPSHDTHRAIFSRVCNINLQSVYSNVPPPPLSTATNSLLTTLRPRREVLLTTSAAITGKLNQFLLPSGHIS